MSRPSRRQDLPPDLARCFSTGQAKTKKAF
jgi:hypothetical protein